MYVDTFGGFLFNRVYVRPVMGNKLVSDGLVYEVAEVERLRIVRIHIYKADKQANG